MLKNIFKVLKEIFLFDEKDFEQKYLSESKDLADLEYREKQIRLKNQRFHHF